MTLSVTQKVFEKTADAIVNIYQKLLPLLNAAEDCVLLMAPEDHDLKKNLNELQSKMNEFFAIFNNQKIFLPRETRKRVTDFAGKILSLLATWDSIEKLHKIQNLSPSGEESLQKLEIKHTLLRTEITPLLAALEDDFQVLLGLMKKKEMQLKTSVMPNAVTQPK